jgi:hypothetical protein
MEQAPSEFRLRRRCRRARFVLHKKQQQQQQMKQALGSPSSARRPRRTLSMMRVAAVYVMAVAFGSAASSAALASAAPAEQDKEDWLSGCRDVGYDPYQLACSTCELIVLPVDSRDNEGCLRCCQRYKDVERIRKPYEAAVLVLHHHQHQHHKASAASKGEFEQFLDEDWAKLVAAKGENRLLQLQDPQLDRFPSLLAGGGPTGGFYFHMPVATLLFFDSFDAVSAHKQNGRKNGGDDALLESAKEVIKLDGWKRDDIRDMLTALLP